MGYITLPSNGGPGANAQGAQAIWTTNAATSGVPGTDPSDGGLRWPQWVPLDTTVKSWFLRTQNAPGATKTVNYRFHYGANQNISTIQQITGAASQEVSNTIEADWPALDPTSDSTLQATWHYFTGWPSTSGNAGGAGCMAIEYLCAANPELAWYIIGVATTIAAGSFGGSDQYSGITDQAISSAQNTQTPWQTRMPIKGRLKYCFAVWRGYTSTTTVEACVQKGTRGGGVDTAMLHTMMGATTTTEYQGLIDSSTEVVVAQGDYLNWRLKRTAGAATTGQFCLGFGFAAGVD